MPRAELTFFGPIHGTFENGEVIHFAYDKVQALLALLVTDADRPLRREMIAGLLWPEQGEQGARHSLNQALWNLRRSLRDQDASAQLLISSRESIQLSPEAGEFSDVRRFVSLTEQVDQHVHRRPESCRACIGWLTEVVALYRGPFLEQFSLPDSPEFEQWALVKRERFQQMTVSALERLIAYHERRNEDQHAIGYLRRLLELDPWREESHRRLMRLLARNGQRLVALAHFDRLTETLETELGTEVERETRKLRDEIERGESATEKVRISLPDRSAPLARLPAQLSTLIGREQTLSELSRLIAGGQQRLITLTGPGGIGKTRLGLQLANEEAEVFSDGVCFVPLAGVSSATSLTQAIADARGLAFRGSRDPREQLLNDLREKDLLLLLDNFEHLLDGAELLADIVSEAPRVQVVVTSREQLNLYGEYVFPVQALDVPAETDEPDAIEQSGAVQLFLRCAERAGAGSNAESFDVASVVRICWLVGGMPLGIELAAAWTPLLTCQEIAREIEQGLDFLATTTRNVPQRHRSVRAAIDHSWRLLANHHRDVFMRLSVFRGGFQKEAAERVAGATLPSLLALMSKSFLTRSPVGRFEVHELLRQYGADKLAGSPAEMEATFDAHARYYAEFLLQREERLKRAEQRAALQELIVESENIRAAWNWALSRARVEVLETLVNVWLFYEVTGRYQEIDRLTGRAIEILEKVDDPRAELAVGQALTHQTVGIQRVGAFGEAEHVLARSREILQRHGDHAELGLNLNFAAMTAHAQGGYQKERRLLDESLQVSRLAGDEWVTAYSLNDLGMVMCLLGDLERAQQTIRESLEIFVAIGDQRGRAFALNNLGIVLARRGSPAEADRLHRESLEIRRSMNDLWGEAQSLTQLGIVARMTGDQRGSSEHFRRALRIASDIHAYPLVLDVFNELTDLIVSPTGRERVQTIMKQISDYAMDRPSSEGQRGLGRRAAGKLQADTAPHSWRPAPVLADLDNIVFEMLLDGSVMTDAAHPTVSESRVDGLSR